MFVALGGSLTAVFFSELLIPGYVVSSKKHIDQNKHMQMQLHFCSAWRLTLKHNQYHKPCLLFLYFSGSLPFLSSRDIDRMMRHGSEIGKSQSAALICTSIAVGPKANTVKTPYAHRSRMCNIGNTLLRPKKKIQNRGRHCCQGARTRCAEGGTLKSKR